MHQQKIPTVFHNTADYLQPLYSCLYGSTVVLIGCTCPAITGGTVIFVSIRCVVVKHGEACMDSVRHSLAAAEMLVVLVATLPHGAAGSATCTGGTLAGGHCICSPPAVCARM